MVLPINPSLYQNSFPENPKMKPHMIDVHDDDDAADETLSLCDLEIYSDAATLQEFSSNKANETSSSSSSSSSLDKDLFEFFSENWNTSSNISSFHSSYTDQPDNIIFCGKLIPSKKPNSPIRINSSSVNQAKPIKKISRGLFRWNSDVSFYKRSSKSNVATTTTPPRSKSVPVPGKYGGKNDTILPKRVQSIFQSPTKSRWYLFLFGMSGGFPTKMELSNIRNRQLRRNPSTMFRVDGGDEVELGGSGRMRLVRALGCGAGMETNTVETASVGCFGGI